MGCSYVPESLKVPRKRFLATVSIGELHEVKCFAKLCRVIIAPTINYPNVKTVHQISLRAERFMAKWIAAEKTRAGLRHAVVCPNVTGGTKEKIVESKRARAGSLAIVN